MGSAFHQLCPRYNGTLAPTASIAIRLWETFFYLRDRICSIFSGPGKFCLAHGLRQLTRDVKNDVRILNFKSDVTDVVP